MTDTRLAATTICFCSRAFQFSEVTGLFRDLRGFWVSLLKSEGILMLLSHSSPCLCNICIFLGQEDFGVHWGNSLSQEPTCQHKPALQMAEPLALPQVQRRQGSSRGSDSYSPAQEHSAQIRGKSNLTDPLREFYSHSVQQ